MSATVNETVSETVCEHMTDVSVCAQYACESATDCWLKRHPFQCDGADLLKVIQAIREEAPLAKCRPWRIGDNYGRKDSHFIYGCARKHGKMLSLTFWRSF